jgi:hypothetical protein
MLAEQVRLNPGQPGLRWVKLVQEHGDLGDHCRGLAGQQRHLRHQTDRRGKRVGAARQRRQGSRLPDRTPVQARQARGPDTIVEECLFAAKREIQESTLSVGIIAEQSGQRPEEHEQHAVIELGGQVHVLFGGSRDAEHGRECPRRAPVDLVARRDAGRERRYFLTAGRGPGDEVADRASAVPQFEPPVAC